jgi:hypothetical protein
MKRGLLVLSLSFLISACQEVKTQTEFEPSPLTEETVSNNDELTSEVGQFSVDLKADGSCPITSTKGKLRQRVVTPISGESLNWPSGFFVTNFGTCKDYAIFFPAYGRKPQLVKGFALSTSADGLKYEGKFDLSLGNPRDSAEIRLADGSVGLVIAETGLEYPHQDWKKWPHGRVWLVTLKDDTISVKTIESGLAFYHSITTGDINDDGLEDVVVQFFGSRDKSLSKQGTLLFLTQNAEGSFVRSKSPIKNSTFGSSILLANLDDDPALELVQASYKHPEPAFRGSFKVYKRKGDKLIKAVEFPRQGLLKKGVGVSKISTIDFDLDGDLDILLQFEAGAKGIQVFENLGNLEFKFRDKGFFEDLPSNIRSYQWREAVVADVDDDGYPDVILQGWGGDESISSGMYDIGAGVYLNLAGKGFKRQKKMPLLTVKNNFQAFHRFYKSGGQNIFYFVDLNGGVERVNISPNQF